MTTPVSSPSMPSPRLRQMDSAHVARVTRNEKELKQQIAVLQHDLDEARQHTNKVTTPLIVFLNFYFILFKTSRLI